jgi:gamma-glutamyltranspeptidase/glutathione hydrolase
MSENYYEKDLKLLIDPNWAKLNRKRIISPSLNVNSVELISSDPDMNDTDWVGQPGAHTSHLVTSDCSGLVVSMTQTIGPIFGAKVASPSLGFAYAATMGGYLRTGPQKPGERPRTAIAPVIVTKEDSVLLALGAAGGIRIPSAIVQTISRVVDQNKSLKDAINAPRVHPLALIDENNRRIIDLRSFSAEMSSPAWTENDLAYWKLNGFNVTELEKRATFGRVHAISQFNAKLVGVSDPDWEGSASTEKNCAK